MSAQDTALILLASGQSKRFGRENKLLADLKGKPIISQVIETITGAGFKALYAVTSEAAVADLLRLSHFQILQNAHPEAGQGNALSIGARAVIADGHTQVCVMLADMPFIPREHLMALISIAESSAVVLSEYDGVVMPPAVFSGVNLTAIAGAQGERGGKDVTRDLKPLTARLTKRAAMDIDTPADLAAARSVG